MSILDDIIKFKKKEVQERKELYPVKYLEKSIYFPTTPVSMKRYLMRADLNGIIAEIKRKSPSKGTINAHVSVEKISIGYMQAGASGLSILTDAEFFGGSSNDLTVARKFNFCPILRKDFIIDEYQVIETKSIGADTILLIAAGLKKNKAIELGQLARSLGLEVLLEIHNESELEFLGDHVDLVGINNRDLTTFETNLETSFRLSDLLPSEMVKVAESGIASPADVMELSNHGFQGFLIGENFMKNGRPEEACARFIDQIKLLRSDKSPDKDKVYGQGS